MTTLPFRVLVVEEDPEILRKLVEKLDGRVVEIGRRRVLARVSAFLIEVDSESSGRKFSSQNLKSFLDTVSVRKFDLIIVDYAYWPASEREQQWNEDGERPSKFRSNANALRLGELKEQLIEIDRRGKRASGFFETRAPVVLRSFQHDRQFETLGTFTERVKATQAIFPNAREIIPLNGFDLIYGGDKELRDTLYHRATGGRLLYRHTIANFTELVLMNSMLDHLARAAGRLLIVRGSAALAALVVTISVLTAITQPFVSGFYAAAIGGDVIGALRALVPGLILVVIPSIVAVVVVDRLLGSVVTVLKKRD